MSKSFIQKGAAVIVGAALFGGVSGGVFNYVVGNRVYQGSDNVTTEISTEYDSSETATATENASDTVVEIAQSDGVVSTSSGLGVTEIVNETMPSVVAITTKSVQEYSNWFMGQSYQYETEGSGSGIIIGKNDTELLIVTNNHVVEDATSVTVGFIDGEAYEAQVKGTNSGCDIAVIEVNLSDLSEGTISQIKVAILGDSDALNVGEQVVAIGNALGYGQSVTTGIVSAKDRTNSTNDTPLIQTDAAINPGNSGGALINMNGEIIGINSSKYSDTSVEGMGYAIPINNVQDIIDDLSNRVVRQKVDADKAGALGVQASTVSSTESTYYGIPVGAYVSEVIEGSAAEKAGIPQRAVIVEFDGNEIESADALVELLEYYEAGEEVEVVCEVYNNLTQEYVEQSYTVTLGSKQDISTDDDSATTEDNSRSNDTDEGEASDDPFDFKGILR